MGRESIPDLPEGMSILRSPKSIRKEVERDSLGREEDTVPGYNLKDKGV